MSGKHDKVGIPAAYINKHVPRALRGIHHHRHTRRMRKRNNFPNGIHRSEYV